MAKYNLDIAFKTWYGEQADGLQGFSGGFVMESNILESTNKNVVFNPGKAYPVTSKQVIIPMRMPLQCADQYYINADETQSGDYKYSNPTILQGSDNAKDWRSNKTDPLLARTGFRTAKNDWTLLDLGTPESNITLRFQINEFAAQLASAADFVSRYIADLQRLISEKLEDIEVQSIVAQGINLAHFWNPGIQGTTERAPNSVYTDIYINSQLAVPGLYDPNCEIIPASEFTPGSGGLYANTADGDASNVAKSSAWNFGNFMYAIAKDMALDVNLAHPTVYVKPHTLSKIRNDPRFIGVLARTDAEYAQTIQGAMNGYAGEFNGVNYVVAPRLSAMRLNYIDGTSGPAPELIFLNPEKVRRYELIDTPLTGLKDSFVRNTVFFQFSEFCQFYLEPVTMWDLYFQSQKKMGILAEQSLKDKPNLAFNTANNILNGEPFHAMPYDDGAFNPEELRASQGAYMLGSGENSSLYPAGASHACFYLMKLEDWGKNDVAIAAAGRKYNQFGFGINNNYEGGQTISDSINGGIKNTPPTSYLASEVSNAAAAYTVTPGASSTTDGIYLSQATKIVNAYVLSAASASASVTFDGLVVTPVDLATGDTVVIVLDNGETIVDKLL